jgi:phosphatidylinositol dimannoside acyltransferase
VTVKTSYRGSGWPGRPVERRTGALDRIPPDHRTEGLRLRVMARLWNAAWEVFRRLPEPLAFGIATVLSRVFCRLNRESRERVRANLARIVPAAELDRAVKRAFRSYARYWVEAFRAADLDPEDLSARTTTNGFEHLDKALEGGKGAIVLLAHHGSWDMAARWGESHGYHLAVVTEVVRPRKLFEKFVRLREQIGLEVVPLRRGDDLAGRLLEVLAANHIVGLLSDRDLTGRAPVAEFFGEPARIPYGPVILSRRSGAPIVPVTMIQRPRRRWHVEVLPAIELPDDSIREGVQAIARALEDLIRTEPTQWHALSPVWLADQPPHRRLPPPRDVGTS